MSIALGLFLLLGVVVGYSMRPGMALLGLAFATIGCIKFYVMSEPPTVVPSVSEWTSVFYFRYLSCMAAGTGVVLGLGASWIARKFRKLPVPD